MSTHGTARLVLTLVAQKPDNWETMPIGKRRTWEKNNTAHYVLHPLRVDQQMARVAWRLTKVCREKVVYDVRVGHDGVTSCDCAASVYRPGEVCKHIRSLTALGLLPGVHIPGRSSHEEVQQAEENSYL